LTAQTDLFATSYLSPEEFNVLGKTSSAMFWSTTITTEEWERRKWKNASNFCTFQFLFKKNLQPSLTCIWKANRKKGNITENLPFMTTPYTFNHLLYSSLQAFVFSSWNKKYKQHSTEKKLSKHKLNSFSFSIGLEPMTSPFIPFLCKDTVPFKLKFIGLNFIIFFF
jgi:hypothetical protein